MFPTTLFGFLALGAAALVALRPERRFVPLVIASSVMTLSMALLGAVIGTLGVVRASGNAAPADLVPLVTACGVQALSSLLVAFLCLTLASVGTAIGAVRHALRAT